MNVFVVRVYDHDLDELAIEGIFTSLGAAQEAFPGNKWKVSSPSVWSNWRGSVVPIEITEFRLQGHLPISLPVLEELTEKCRQQHAGMANAHVVAELGDVVN